MRTDVLSESIKNFILDRIMRLSDSTPLLGFVYPLVSRAVNKNISRLSRILDLVSDENGNVDIQDLLTEMTQNLMSTKPFTLNTDFIGDIYIGGGVIKLNIPLTDKQLVIDNKDILEFKELLTINEH